MKTCWANALGGCSGTISREHLVSKSLFASPHVSAHGFPWCKDQPLHVGIDAITAKILCRKHNSDLSELDSAASFAFDILRRRARPNTNRKTGSVIADLRAAPDVIDAKLLERWFLKTLVNFMYGKDFFIGVDGPTVGVPSKRLVEICYGRSPFEGNSGMYVCANPGMAIRSAEELKFMPVLVGNQTVLSGLFEFFGFRFLLNLAIDVVPDLSTTSGIQADWKHANLLRPFLTMFEQCGPLLSRPVVAFQW